jgi:hypothetical protein
MSQIIWAICSDGGSIAVDLETSKRFRLPADNPWGSIRLYHEPGRALWILEGRRLVQEIQGGVRAATPRENLDGASLPNPVRARG